MSDMTESTDKQEQGSTRHIPIWPARRTVQVLVILALFACPVLARYSHYLSARKLDKVMEKWEGTLQGSLLAGTDRAIRVGIPDGEGGVPERRPRKAILQRSRLIYGSPWSMNLLGLSVTDLLAGAESIAASRTVRWVLLSSLLVPLILTGLLGRVFCGYICPMGLLFDISAKVRTLLRRLLEIRPLSVRVSRGNKYILLGVGLLIVIGAGLPLLHLLYPPAILGREVHGFVMALFDRAENGYLGLALAGLTGASVLLLGLILLEIFVAPRFFCQSICPGGAIYSLLGRFRLLRVRRKIAGCDLCGICNQRCPRGLLPMNDATGMECDNCGLCVDVCPTRAMTFRVSLTDASLGASTSKASPAPPARRALEKALGAVLVFLAALGAPTTAYGHHILGIPHYAYDESYPQAPVLKLKEKVGVWEFQLTSYPGNPQPGDRSQIHVYMSRSIDGKLYDRPLSIEVRRLHMLGPKEVVHEASADRLENVFKFFLAYPGEGNYEIQLSFDDLQGTSTLTLPMVVGDPGSPLATLGAFSGGMLLLILVIRSIRIKRARSLRRREIMAGSGSKMGGEQP